MAEAVLEISEDTVVDAFLDPARKKPAECSIHGRARLRIAGEQKGHIDKAEFGNAVCQVARRLIAECEQSMLDQPQNILGAIAEVHDVPDVLDAHAVAEFALELIAHHFQRAREAGRRRAVTAHANLDRVAHSVIFPLAVGSPPWDAATRLSL